MLSKNKIKYIQSLKLKKFRQKYNIFIAEGDKIAREILQDTSIKVNEIYAQSLWIQQHNELLSKHINKTLTVSEAELKKISQLSTPNQVLILAEQLNAIIDISCIQQHFSLYLDGIQDPGNLGTIIRIADWFGLPYVFCSPQCADLYNPKVLQASMGGFLRVKVISIPFSELIAQLDNIKVYGTVLDGNSVYKMNFEGAGILVIGNESKGISSEIQAQLTHKVAIPRFGGAESLNAAVATGIITAIIKQQ